MLPPGALMLAAGERTVGECSQEEARWRKWTLYRNLENEQVEGWQRAEDQIHYRLCFFPLDGGLFEIVITTMVK